jgi:ABC-type glycerol-3-phosphate transport system permease component
MISIATHWNDYFWPLIVTESDTVRTLTIGLGMFVQQESGSDWTLLMAATLFICAPIIGLFLVLQRTFIQSFMTSGIKG